jgi:hypothetical protein
VLLYVGTAAERFDLVEKHWQIAAELGLETAADRNVASMYIIRGDVDPVIRAFGWEDADIPLCIAAVRDPALRPQLKETLEVLDINSAEQINAIVGPIRALDLCYTMVGQDEKAIDMLDTFIRNETWYGVSAYWKPGEGTRRLRQNPRFKALMHEMGLVDYWRENGWPDWCRADGENDFACD